MKGTHMDGTYLLAMVCAVGFIGSVTMICMKDNGANAAMTRANEVAGKLTAYATKDEVKNVGDLSYQASTKTQKALEDYQAKNDLRNKLADDDFSELKTRVESMQMQVNKHHAAVKALPPKQVHVMHSYTTPMQVDLTTYPDKQMKGRGQKSLLERSRQ